ncbi:hypothetical protein [Neoroseomonas rubea]|uniref:hypothetical protein n=1 Tax=Neoroseomonas rubea TaxID=2748666 RepID=UPI0018DF1C3A|nr:hypothetical protein [Roseomonas rubea]
MEQLRIAADLSIRRACGFGGLGIGCTMLALAYDFPLSLRIGGDLMAIGCAIMLLAAWWVPYRDLRHAEVWYLMPQWAFDALRSRPRAEWHAMVARVLRARMLWHAERVGAAALVLWGAGWITASLR